jgi:hypothetical protein
VHEPPVSDTPWSQTLDRLLTGRRAGGRRREGGGDRDELEVQGVHPDAQLGSKGLVKPLDGEDNADQESVMKVVWQCVRSGQVGRAQQIAQKHQWFWLTAALMGAQPEYYKGSTRDGGLFGEDGPDDEGKDGDAAGGWGGAGLNRRGNINRAVWMQTCWKYSSLVDSNPSNKKTVQASGRHVARDAESSGGSHVGVLEVAVYAALSCNLPPLMGSPLVSSWTDSLWAVVACAHERQITAVISDFHKRRVAHSRLYPGSTKAVLAAEKQFLQRTEELDGYLDGNCDKLFRRLDKPVSSTGSEVAIMLLELQVAVIKGAGALDKYIQDTVMPYAIATLEAAAPTNDIGASDMESISLSSPRRPLAGGHSASSTAAAADSNFFSHQRSRTLRVFAHLVLWLRFSCPHCASLQTLAPNKVIYVVVEAYIEQLIHRRQYSLVALYAAFLSRPRRVDKYVAMMRRISPNSTKHAIVLGDGGTGGGSTSTALTLNDDTATAVEVLQLAHKFFREEEVLEITKEVVEGARKGRRGWCDYDDLDDPNVSSVSMQQTPGQAQHKRSGLYSVPLSQQTPLSRGVPVTPASAWSSRSKDSPDFSRSAIATPFRGHGAMALTLGGGAGDGSDGNDASRLESLRWLCHRPDQRVSAVCKANAFLRALMLESHGSKTPQVRSLLWDILPLQVLEEGDVQQAGRTSLLSDEGRQDQAAAEEESWAAEVCQLHFWRGFDASVALFEQWTEEVGKPYKELPSMLGDATTKAKSLAHHRPKVRQAAEGAVSGILAALTCSYRDPATEKHASANDGAAERHSVEDLYASGFQQVWVRSIDVAYNGLIGMQPASVVAE